VASYDFSAPFVAARIIDADGNAWPLWVNVGGGEDGRPWIPGGEDLKALCWVDQVEVKLDLSGVPTITVQLSPPFEEGIKFLDSELINSAGENKIEVQLGYATGISDGRPLLTPVFSAMIFNPQVSIDIDIQITLTGQGDAAYGPTRQGAQRVTTGRERRYDVIQMLAQGAGRIVEVNFDSANRDDECRRLLEGEVEFVQGNRTDWVALWQLARQTKCWMSVQGNTLYWLSYAERFALQPTRTYRMYHYPGGRIQGMTDNAQQQAGEGDLPILSFSCDTDSVWLPASQFGIMLRDLSAETRQVQERFASPRTEANVAGGDGAESVRGTSSLPHNEQTQEGAALRPGHPDDPDAQTQVSSEIQQGGNLGISVQLEVPGDPVVLPGHTVRLAGLGRRFDPMVYAVYTVTHSIGTGGFTTNLTLVTNINAAASEIMGAIPPTGARNTQQTRTDSNSSTDAPSPRTQGDR
jgi:hypothetical protein